MAIDLGDAKITINVDDKASKKLDALEGRMSKMSKSFQKAGLAMMGAGVVLGGGLIVLAKGAADFDTAMREVNTMLLLSQTEFQAFSDDVKDLAFEMGVDAVESAQALYQAISAGIPKENVIEFLTVATKAAIGGVTDLTVAVDGLTTIINAFKLPMSDAQKVADAMFTTVKGGKTTFEELSASMAKAMPTAAALGVGYEEVLATIATLTKQGVPTAEAFTQIRASMVALLKPTADMEGLLRKAGYESGRAMLKALGYQGALNALTVAAEGNDAVLAKAFGSVEALGVVFGITGGNALMAAGDIDAMANSAGAALDAFEVMEEGVGRQFEKIKEQIETLGIEIGETLLPVFSDILEDMEPIIESFRNWVEANEELFPTLLKLAGVLVGAGGVLFAFAQIVKIVKTLVVALSVLHALSGPAGWIKLAAGLAIAGAAIYGFKKLMETPEVPGLPELSEVPGLPSAQFGGIIPGPIGQPVPIMAHGGEEFAGVGKSIGGNTYEFYIGNFMGDESSQRALVSKFKEIMGQENRRTSFNGINRAEYFPGSSSV